MFTKTLQLRSVAIAKEIAPKRSGNLAFNSIKSGSFSPSAFTIRYDVRAANYAVFLEEGSGPVKRHKGFISKKTAPAIAQYVQSYMSDNRGTVPYNYQRLAFESKTNPLRQERFLRSQRFVARGN